MVVIPTLHDEPTIVLTIFFTIIGKYFILLALWSSIQLTELNLKGEIVIVKAKSKA